MYGTRKIGLLVGLLAVFFVGAGFGNLAKPPEVERTTVVDTLILSQDRYRDHVVTIEARRAGVPIDLALAVSHAENWSGDPAAVSTAGAIGIMQVLPYKKNGEPLWVNAWPMECYGEATLEDPWRNACVGTRVLLGYYTACGDWNCALRLYNGSADYERSGDRYIASVVTRLSFNGNSTRASP